jgi:sensor histidine kinase YesM
MPRHDSPFNQALHRVTVLPCLFAVAGALISFTHASQGGFWIIQIYAQFVGFTALGCFLLLHLALYRRNSSPPLIRFCLLIVSFPLGLEVGGNLAAWLLGHPLEINRVAHESRVALFICVLTIAAIIYIFRTQRRLAESRAEQAEAQRAIAEAQLRLLQTQLEPHMLFNTLANLRSLIEVDAVQAQVMVDHFIVFLRQTLTASRNEETTLGAEFALLGAYLELMRIRMDARLEVSLDLPESLRDRRVPSMLLQPLVENAIKHGLEPKVSGGRIAVAAKQDGGQLVLCISDTGIGLQPTTNEGYGLTHVRERLHMRYGDAASLQLSPSAEGGATALVRMPA